MPESKQKKQIEVVAAIIIHQNKYLCVQRSESQLEYISKKYEFPGGKIEQDETKEQAIIREIKEELEINIEVGNEFMTVYHEYPDFNLTMYSFLCESESFTVHLTEHIDHRWLPREQLDILDWAAADVPIVEKIMSRHD
jgi:8-oxo-dGTP diphosphatase